MMDRVALFVDGANFFYMQRDGLHWRVDPKLLIGYAGLIYGNVVDAYYYIGKGDSPEPGHANFLTALPYMGYALVSKPIKNIRQKDGTIKQKANLDVEMVLDLFNTIESYDMAILVCGDGDFERPLTLLRARGKRFKVISTEGFIAKELREVLGMHYIDFNEIREFVEKDQPKGQEKETQ